MHELMQSAMLTLGADLYNRLCSEFQPSAGARELSDSHVQPAPSGLAPLGVDPDGMIRSTQLSFRQRVFPPGTVVQPQADPRVLGVAGVKVVPSETDRNSVLAKFSPKNIYNRRQRGK